jgi:hypothetical protein
MPCLRRTPRWRMSGGRLFATCWPEDMWMFWVFENRCARALGAYVLGTFPPDFFTGKRIYPAAMTFAGPWVTREEGLSYWEGAAWLLSS